MYLSDEGHGAVLSVLQRTQLHHGVLDLATVLEITGDGPEKVLGGIL